VPLAEVMRRFNGTGTALRRVWEVPFDRLAPGAGSIGGGRWEPGKHPEPK
jgi:hypothetical protein